MDIKIMGISKSFGDYTAVEPLNLHIYKGELLTLLGPSGCGKTTLLRMIAGLTTPDSGEISIGNHTVFNKKKSIPAEKRGLGMVFQDWALWPHMTVFDNVAYSLRATGQKVDLLEKVTRVLEKVGLGDKINHYPNELSGGQQQRVAFARAVVNQPKVLLLDEPLSALDASLREQLKHEIVSLIRAFNLTAIYVTHDQSEAMALSDRIAVMKDGKLQQIGPPEEIYQSPDNLFVAQFIGKSNDIQRAMIQTYHETTVQIKIGDHDFTLQRPPSLKGHEGEKITLMIRPEYLSLKSNPEWMKFSVRFISSLFLGERYEWLVSITETDEEWTLYTNEKKPLNDEFNIYVDSEKFAVFLAEN